MLKAQESKPTKGDWYITVCADIQKFDLKCTMDEIQNMSKNQFKRTVKKSMKTVAFKYLNDEKTEKQK